MNLYQHAKKPNYLSSRSSNSTDLKILQSDWLRAFRSIPQEPDFSNIRDLYMNIANNINFHYEPNAEKITEQIFQQLKKNLFLFMGRKKVSRSKESIQYPEHVRTERRTDRQAPFYRTLLATTRGPKNDKKSR